MSGSLPASDFRPLALLLQEGKEALLSGLPIDKAAPRYLLTERDFMRISDEDTPQGIALLAERPSLNLLAHPPRAAFLPYLEQVNDPGNLGTIIRSLLWFGHHEILLSPGSVDPFSPKAVRSSAGSVTHCRIYEDIELDKLRTMRNEKSYKILGTAMDGERTIREWHPAKDERWILLFGSEAHGLSREARSMCDQLVAIPKPGFGESLNLATSVALFLYQAG